MRGKRNEMEAAAVAGSFIVELRTRRRVLAIERAISMGTASIAGSNSSHSPAKNTRDVNARQRRAGNEIEAADADADAVWRSNVVEMPTTRTIEIETASWISSSAHARSPVPNASDMNARQMRQTRAEEGGFFQKRRSLKK
jgi:hypothetical protein